ncbi:Uncharacterised protein [Mycobacteroides abscessus subsp. massiliense]|uniref:hypothetical protein n=1 Tax=Mycobacteroides abscessus TaxID=36809 RepID=UPI0009A57211|nr:hypothetical protein [Mycobacteroides abscessus]SKZ39448.1 Uncharacterised protein [Mycobacteroides abscessus subsp. massiliense]SKZ39665.1 Uncharacterised protein [Mycobacteroides abscessus subsp. massiliense]
MLSRIASEFAAEIAYHDWQDAPWRLDRAGHQRDQESPSKRSEKWLKADEAENVRTNVMWVTAQVLKHLDPNLDLHEYAEACDVPRRITHRSNGSRSDAIRYGIRGNGESADAPGAHQWRVTVHFPVAADANAFEGHLAALADLTPQHQQADGARSQFTLTIPGRHAANRRAAVAQAIAALTSTFGEPTAAPTVVMVEPI